MAKKDALLIPLLSRILDVPEAALHDDRNLMHDGMDSMRTMRAATWLRREGVAVTFSDFIDKRTVREWRQVISAAGEYRAVDDVDAPRCNTPGFELATMQHAFWIGRNERQQLGGVSAHFYAELEGKALDPERLANALNRLIQRHDMLRLRIDQDSRLHIAPDSPCKLQINDLRELSAEQCHARLAVLRQCYTHQQLDIANGETLMLALSLLPTGDSRLHIDLDMIAGDAASLRILLRELAQGYRQPDYALPPLRSRYLDYRPRWQEKHQHRREQDRAWWQTQLSRLATSPTLPLQSSEKSAPVTERRYLWLNPTQQQHLTTMSHQSGLTVPVVLATLFGECIGLWSGGAPFLLNLPVFSRDEEIADADRLVGDFSSSVLINVEPGSAENIIEQARQLQTQLHRALAHTAWSGVDVLRDLSRQQQSNASLAPVVFTSALALGDLFEPQVRAVLGEPVWSVSQGPQVLIDAQATEYLNGIMLNWDVRTDRFAPGVIDAMFDGFQQQVHALLDDITCWQRPLPVPQPVAPWPPETAEPASAPTLLHRFFMQAEREPDAIALQWGERGVMHYGELAQSALCIARFLQEQGIKTGDSVAISMGKGPEQVIAVLGTLAAGATYVPCGIDMPLARREAVYRLANVALVLCDSRSAYQPEWAQAIPVFPLVQGLQALPLAASVEVDEQQAMYVIFTSGTTGEPKGVAVSHRAVANTVDGVDTYFTVTPRDCTITLSALDFDLSAYDIFSCLSRGARLAVVEEHQRRDAHEWLALIQRYDVSIISCVPALLEMILTAAGDSPLSSARLVMLGGDRIPVTLAERWWRRTAGAPFVGLGGMTEAAIHSTLFVLHADDPRWTTVPFGTPLPNMYCRIVDALGRDCPPWVAGELWVSGPGLALGYRNDAARTAEKFVEHAGRRWYRSGDRARYWPDGTIDYLGRHDQQIKIRGHRIEPGEVEAALMRHPAIHSACVTVVESAARQLCATLVTDENNSASVWQSWLQPRLPRYAIPEHYVVVSALPVTENGKTDRARVERLAAAQVTLTRTTRSAPENDIERQVAALWATLLNVDSVSREDNFFVLGGDSLVATRLIAALRERQLSAPLHALFTSPELRDFCHYVQAESAVSLPTLVADDAGRYKPFPLSDLQRAFWIGRSEQMTLGGVGSHFYIEFDGEGLDVARLEAAWQQLIARHAMLRAVVTEAGEQQVLPDTQPYRIERHTACDDVEGALQTWRDTLSHRVYDVREWPLFSIQVVDYQQGGDARQRLMVSLDSMMFDGRSIMILFSEWDALYCDPRVTLPALRIHYRDYQCGQVEYNAALMPQAKAYWLERLVTLPAAPALPLAVRPETIAKPRFQRRRYVLPAESWQRFMSQAQRHGITVSVALAAAYGEVLAFWSNQSALALNFTLFDRQPLHPDINRIVGDFASILLLGYESAQGRDFCQATMQLQQQVGEGLSHRQFSGVRVLRELARHHGQSMATMPVVFTSVLGLEKDASVALSDAFPRVHYTLTQTPQVWLDAKVSESQGCLLLEWDVVEALFSPGVIDSLFAAYCHLVESLVQADWCQPVSLSLPVEQQRLRAQINQTAMDFGNNIVPYLRVFAQAQRAPQATALVWGDHGVMHYGEMTRQALSVAAYLMQQGIQPGDKVAITHRKGAAQIVGVLGVLAAGGCYVPCNIALPLARREQIYQAAQVRWVLTDDESLTHLDWPAAFPVVALSTALTCAPLQEPVVQPDYAPLYVIFTSGSTGAPKGVVVSHGAVANTIDAVTRRFDLSVSDRSITLSALDFDLSAFDIFTFLGMGASLAVVEEPQWRDAAAWAALMARWQVSVVSAVPAQVEMLTIVAHESGLPQSLRLVMVGGDRILYPLPHQLWALAPQARFAALGGMTEVAIHATCYIVTPDEPWWPAAPYGEPLANMRCRVVDGQERDCPNGVKGELWVSGAGLADGYIGDAQRSAEKFVVRQGATWYRTGDRAYYRDDGVLVFCGRTDGQVKVRGYRIELAEIEGALTRLPEIDEAVAVVLDTPSQQVVAALVCPETTDMAGIKKALQAWLPEYEVPEHLIRIARVPLTANGKIDRATVSDEVQSYLNGLRDERAGALPVGRAEQVLAALWGELLDLDTVTREANFFALGGDSLIATRLISRLPQDGFHGTLASLFRQPVLHAFAATLREVMPEQQNRLHHDATQRYHPFPLNDVQEAYWLGRRDGFVLGGIAAQSYHEYELHHADLMRLEHAWNQLVTRHDMLRCVIGEDGQQHIMEEVPYFYFRYHDLRHLADASAQLALLRNRMAHQVLATGSGRLYDITLIDYGAGKSRLAVLFDNLIVDGLSMLTLFSEWFECYQNPETELPALTIQFRDYQCWRAQQGQTQEDIVYWQQRFDALPPAPALPTRMLPAAIITPRFRRLEARLEPALWRQLSDRARQAQITPSVLLLTCFAETLSRWSGQKALVITLTQFDRQPFHPDINRVVGDFTSLTLAEYHADNAESWLRHAQRLQEQVWHDLGHASVSAIAVQRALAQQAGNEMQAAPVVFTSMLGVADALAKAVPWPSYTSSQTPQVWLDHQAIDLADGVLLSWDYLEELFLPDMVEQMFAWYCHTLRTLAGNDWLAPPIRDLPVAQRQMRLQANSTGGPMPNHRALHDAFFSQAQQWPERPALWDSVNGYLSYGALREQALTVAAGLLHRGIHTGDCVALCLPSGSERMVALLGILAVGAAYLPLNQAHPTARHALLCREASVKAVICDNDLSFALPTYSLASLRDNAPLTAPIIPADDSLAYVLFTSGSTGEPKGVMIEHRNVLNTLEAVCQQLDISAQDVFLAVSALDFDLSVFDMFAALSAGGLLVLAEDSPHHDADQWLTLMSTHGVSVWNSVPSLFDMLCTLARARQVTLPNLRIALLSGDWVEPDSGERLRTIAPSAQTFALGGATEAAIWSTIWPLSSSIPEGYHTVPYGFPLRNQRVRVVDTLGNDTPDWVPGELWIGGLGVARGYCADSRLTTLHFNGDYPWRWYRSGDRGRYRPDGVLEFLGRIDKQVKLQGHRIELSEIEFILLRHPRIRHAVAVVQGDGAMARLHAFVQMDAAEEEINVLLSALHHELRITLPGYAIPEAISAVTTWPLTPSGKIDRRQLALLSPHSTSPLPAKNSELQHVVAALWQQMVEGPLPSGTDSFFRAGGNSLLGTKLVAQVCEEFSINLTIKEFFSDATLSGLCACVERHLADRARMEEGSL